MYGTPIPQSKTLNRNPSINKIDSINSNLNEQLGELIKYNKNNESFFDLDDKCKLNKIIFLV